MDKKRLVNTFLEAVRIDSPTGHEENMANWIVQKLAGFGFSPIRDKYGNIVAKIPGEGNPIILTAHLDTVEPGRGIMPRIEKGIIKSSGNTILGADNKVAVAAILEVLESIRGRGNHASLEVVFTLSEEVGNFGAVNLDYSLISSKEGFAFDTTGPIGEIVTASPFYNRFDIEIIGKAAHAGKPQKAINALKIFANAANKIKLGKIDKDTICNIGMISGGSVRNTIPGNISIKGEVRSFLEDRLENATAEITSAFKSEAEALGGRIECEVARENGGYKLSRKNVLIQRIIRVMNRQKINPKLKKSLGCADSNIFCDHGITVVNMSGGSEKAHTLEENVSIENLEKLTNLMLGLVKVR